MDVLFISGRNWVYWPGCLVNLLRGCVVYFGKELGLLAWLSGESVTWMCCLFREGTGFIGLAVW